MKIIKGLFSHGFNQAPLNPDFLKCLEDIKLQRSSDKPERMPFRGYIPTPLMLTHLKRKRIFSPAGSPVLPSKYDLRQEGRVTSVKDEGSAGNAWAFAAYGSLESCLLPEEEWDFSENNMNDLLCKNCPEGFDRDYNGPGDFRMATAYMARWNGPVLESEDPYDPDKKVTCIEFAPQKHLQKVVFLPANFGAFPDFTNIKLAIMNYGAVASAMYFNYAYWEDTNFSYYFDGNVLAGINHAVCLVGWDDNYDRREFKNLPPGPGALIAKNCWGTEWGDQGYFYISYYDHWIGADNVLFSKAMKPNKYNVIYQYDPLGWVNSGGYYSETAWFANMFTATSDQELHAVSWYAASPGSTYDLFIYLNPNDSQPRSGEMVKSISGTITEPSYYCKAFAAPIMLTSNQTFAVVVRLTTPGFYYPVPFQMPIAGYSSKAVGSPGQGFVSNDGNVWNDITEESENSSVCLKAFAKS